MQDSSVAVMHSKYMIKVGIMGVLGSLDKVHSL